MLLINVDDGTLVKWAELSRDIEELEISMSLDTWFYVEGELEGYMDEWLILLAEY